QMSRFPLADPRQDAMRELPNFINVGNTRIREFFVPQEFAKDYHDPTYLGTGGYGTVIGLACKDKNRKGIAIKKFLTPFDSPKKAQRCYRELQLLHDLDHENIVKMRCAYTTDKRMNELFQVYLTTEFAGLDLGIRLEHETAAHHVYSLNSFKRMISDLLRALKYLSSANVIHRDLKPENLAIDDDGKLTLLDFGIARVADENNEHTKNPGTKYYRPIETIAFGMNDRQIYNGEKADMWSIGAILCEMITGSILFKSDPSKSDQPVLRSIEICGPIPENVMVEDVDDVPSQGYLRNKSQNAVRRDFLQYFLQQGRPWLRNEIINDGAAIVDFINRTLAFDHRARMTVNEALAHPFLALARVPHKEILANHTIPDVGELNLEQYRQLLWNAIKASPVR
ncbi:hypothetical protein PRIPAC_80761, partial [Pristionchus pacificus]